jgi:hypothetical protein
MYILNPNLNPKQCTRRHYAAQHAYLVL